MPIPTTYPIERLDGPQFVVTPEVILTSDGVEGSPPNGGNVSDRLVAFTVDNSLEDALGEMTLTFPLGKGEDSLSPLMQASIWKFSGSDRPAFDPNLRVFLGISIDDPALSFRGVSPTVLMEGRVDDVEFAEDSLTLICRDAASPVADRRIRTTKMYGATGGKEASLVMREILADNGFPSPAELTVTAPPDWLLEPFPVDGINVLEVLRIIAQQAGRDVRYVPGSGLLYYDPGRSRTEPDAIIGPNRYETIEQLRVSAADVVNDWDVYWQDNDGVVQGPEHAEDAASILRYGRRPALIYLNRAENIRSQAAGAAYAAFALADTKEPLASHRIRMPLYPPVLLNDLHLYKANTREYDTDQLFAVAAYRHEWRARQGDDEGIAATTIAARKNPISAYRDYRLSIPPAVIVSTQPPDDGVYAPENTIHLQVATLTP